MEEGCRQQEMHKYATGRERNVEEKVWKVFDVRKRKSFEAYHLKGGRGNNAIKVLGKLIEDKNTIKKKRKIRGNCCRRTRTQTRWKIRPKKIY